MKRMLVALLLLAVSANISFAGDNVENSIRLVVPNSNLIPSADIKSGDELMGLYCTNVGYMIMPTVVQTEFGVDTLKRKVMRVYTKSEMQPLFLLAGIPQLKPGKVPTLFSGEKFLYPGEAFVLPSTDERCGGKDYVLRAYGKVINQLQNNLIYDYAIKVFNGADSQILDYYKSAPGAKWEPGKFAVLTLPEISLGEDSAPSYDLPTLLWAGDVDSDGKLDLFMWWPCPGKSAGVYSLFLSSASKPHQLMVKIPAGIRLAEFKPDVCVRRER